MLMENYKEHANGGIFMLWEPRKVEVRTICCTDQFLHCGVYDFGGNFKHWITVVYASDRLDKRRVLCKDIERISIQNQDPWCIMGDFNNVMSTHDIV